MVDSFVALVWNTQFQKLVEYLGEVLKELLLTVSISVDVFAELLVVLHGNFSGKHHNLGVLLVNELRGTASLDSLLDPLAVTKSLVVLVGEQSGGFLPGTLKTRAIRVATAERVSTSKGDNLLVVEAHAVEDVTNVTLTLSGIGKTTVRGTTLTVRSILATRSPWDSGTTLIMNERLELAIKDICCHMPYHIPVPEQHRYRQESTSHHKRSRGTFP